MSRIFVFARYYSTSVLYSPLPLPSYILYVYIYVCIAKKQKLSRLSLYSSTATVLALERARDQFLSVSLPYYFLQQTFVLNIAKK
jgi:hypothetical protein